MVTNINKPYFSDRNQKRKLTEIIGRADCNGIKSKTVKLVAN